MTHPTALHRPPPPSTTLHHPPPPSTAPLEQKSFKNLFVLLDEDRVESHYCLPSSDWVTASTEPVTKTSIDSNCDRILSIGFQTGQRWRSLRSCKRLKMGQRFFLIIIKQERQTNRQTDRQEEIFICRFFSPESLSLSERETMEHVGLIQFNWHFPHGVPGDWEGRSLRPESSFENATCHTILIMAAILEIFLWLLPVIMANYGAITSKNRPISRTCPSSFDPASIISSIPSLSVGKIPLESLETLEQWNAIADDQFLPVNEVDMSLEVEIDTRLQPVASWSDPLGSFHSPSHERPSWFTQLIVNLMQSHAITAQKVTGRRGNDPKSPSTLHFPPPQDSMQITINRFHFSSIY